MIGRPGARLPPTPGRRDWGPASRDPGQGLAGPREPEDEAEGDEADETGGGRADRARADRQGPCDRVQECLSPPPARRRQFEEPPYLCASLLWAALAGHATVLLVDLVFGATYCASPLELDAAPDAEHTNGRQCGS